MFYKNSTANLYINTGQLLKIMQRRWDLFIFFLVKSVLVKKTDETLHKKDMLQCNKRRK